MMNLTLMMRAQQAFKMGKNIKKNKVSNKSNFCSKQSLKNYLNSFLLLKKNLSKNNNKNKIFLNTSDKFVHIVLKLKIHKICLVKFL